MAENEQEQQEIILKLSAFEQQIKQIQEQIQAVEQGIADLQKLKFDLKELENSQDKEILASVGRGIFAKAKLTSDKLTVDIGNKVFIEKTIPEAQKLIEEQVEKLKTVQKELESNLESVGKEVEKVFSEIRN